MLTKEGTFRVYPLSWTLEEKKSGSACIAVELCVAQEWSPNADETGGDWSDEWPRGYNCYLRSWVIKKDGTLNDTAIQNLAECGLWNGDWDLLAGPPPNLYLIVDVANDPYEGRDQFRADWPQLNADIPKARSTGFAPANPNLLAQMRQRFAGAAKAIAGGQPTGAVPAPAPAPPAPAPAPAPVAAPVAPVAAPAPPAAPPAPAPAPAPTAPVDPQAAPPAVAPPGTAPQVPPAGAQPPAAPPPPPAPPANGPGPAMTQEEFVDGANPPF